MKRLIPILFFCLTVPAPVIAQDNEPEKILNAAIYQEEINGNLEAHGLNGRVPLAIAVNGTIAAVIGATDAPGGYWTGGNVFVLDGGEKTQITFHNRELKSELDLAIVERVDLPGFEVAGQHRECLFEAGLGEGKFGDALALEFTQPVEDSQASSVQMLSSSQSSGVPG